MEHKVLNASKRVGGKGARDASAGADAYRDRIRPRRTLAIVHRRARIPEGNTRHHRVHMGKTKIDGASPTPS
jgi:hypothetical protein